MKQLALIISMLSVISLKAQSDSLIRQVYERWGESARFQRLAPSDHLFYLMGMDTATRWQEVDQIYRYYFSDTSIYKGFDQEKTTAFFVLTQVFKIQEKAPIETLAYYLKEQQKVAYTTEVKGIIRRLQRMRGHWSDEEIRQYAHDRYAKTKASCTLPDGQLKALWYAINQEQEKLLEVK